MGQPQLARIAVLIPVWQPDYRLCDLVSQLVDAGFGAILVVDDGSDMRHDRVFRSVLPNLSIASRSRVHVLRHAENLGKGRALKTGLLYFARHLPGYTGIVTADADGQHRREDILKVAGRLEREGARFVMGSRNLSGRSIPARSLAGNMLTRGIFTALTGTRLRDTQSGLRGIPAGLVNTLLSLEGERYEYEMNVLVHVAQASQIVEVPVEAVYLDGNESSHFHPFRDSMRICFLLLRFAASSLIAAALDFAIFIGAFVLTSNVPWSMIAGRTSSIVNFALNRRYVFHGHGSIAAPIAKYYALAAVSGFAAYLGILLLRGHHVNTVIAKAVVETVLWFVSFSIQRSVVFPRRAVREEMAVPAPSETLS
ncbi:MAG TPA: glycosyltransferase [Bryobacteraceae bacterium]|nr:glycosyltransferase [Bryobacteraceae bacterium]